MKLPLTKLNAKCHSGRQMLTQKRCSVGRDAKAGLEELIVRLVNRGLAKRHGGERWKPHARRQREECDGFDRLGSGGSTE